MIKLTIVLVDGAKDVPAETLTGLVARVVAEGVYSGFDAGAVRDEDGRLLGSWSHVRSSAR